MTLNRRRFLQSTAATAAAGMFASSAFAEDAIGVASIHDLSGGLDIYGKPMVDAIMLAVEEANAAGGLLGRQIKLINYDTQSNMQLYTQFAQQAALKDKVAVVHGGITSASREVIRPVLDRFKTLYFYNTQYEGGVCDRDQFDTGVTPAQTVEKLVPYAMKKWGKKVYVVAADYNYGQITSQWVKKYVLENGGEVPSIDEAFVAAFHKRFGADYPNITELAMGTYQGFRLWAEAVKKAGSVDRIKVIEALETGISIDAPSGKVTIDPPTHHCVLDVHIAEVSDKKLKVLENFSQQKPADTAAVCDLIKNPNDNQQYVIKI